MNEVRIIRQPGLRTCSGSGRMFQGVANKISIPTLQPQLETASAYSLVAGAL